MKLLIIILLSILSGILYRLGGRFQTKIRDIGVPIVATIALLYFGFKNPIGLFLHFGLLFGALTTYWKKKNEDAKWWNWLLTGLGYSLAALPIAWITKYWLGFGIRIVILSGLITLWSELVNQDWLEEGGRGILIIITLPLLFIGV